MPDSEKSPFIELSNTCHSITRDGVSTPGRGKWKLHTRTPHQVFEQLRETILSSDITDVISIKVPSAPALGVDKVLVTTGPYTDMDKVTRVAEELIKLHQKHDFQLTRSLHFETDLQTTWFEEHSQPGDHYHGLLKHNNWIYKYSDGQLEINHEIQALHQTLEEPTENTDPELLRVRSLLAEELFPGSKRPE